MEKFAVSQDRIEKVLIAMKLNSFRILDVSGEELTDCECEKFIKAIYGGNPYASMSALYKTNKRRREPDSD